ncbi:hypothetical protein [Phascolarctobacterium succinatutens]|uniref:hypothetical protein n=1 Tax=Phascolarctobacterium succinatutens TaxID=626940 RepID=UPI0026F1E05B|nr:hypothetical protein [Phascolarctobacterium succinatutens]
MFVTADVKKSAIKRCAFCKYWNDPANRCIRPKFANVGLWEYDNSAEAVCLKKGMKYKAFNSCQDYECKIS